MIRQIIESLEQRLVYAFTGPNAQIAVNVHDLRKLIDAAKKTLSTEDSTLSVDPSIFTNIHVMQINKHKGQFIDFLFTIHVDEVGNLHYIVDEKKQEVWQIAASTYQTAYRHNSPTTSTVKEMLDFVKRYPSLYAKVLNILMNPTDDSFPEEKPSEPQNVD